jgi:hypothetical protein
MQLLHNWNYKGTVQTRLVLYRELKLFARVIVAVCGIAGNSDDVRGNPTHIQNH